MMQEFFLLPNLLSFSRIVIAFYVSYLMIEGRFQEGVLWAFLGGVTDFFDGFFARKMNLESAFGAMLDPLADKIFALVIFLTCVYLSWIPLWLLVLVLLREITILGGGLALKISGVPFEISPLWSSKINTAFQFLLIGSLILQNMSPIFLAVSNGLIFLMALTTVYSWCEYIVKGVGILQHHIRG